MAGPDFFVSNFYFSSFVKFNCIGGGLIFRHGVFDGEPDIAAGAD